MKAMWESSESFTAYATIAFCYWRLNKLTDELLTPQPPIVSMIDNATGYSSRHDEEIVSLLDEIIANKKEIGADYSKDEDFKKTFNSMRRKK